MKVSFDKLLTTVTMAALLGLLVLNSKGASELINAIAGGTSQYIQALQGGGGRNG